MGDQVEAHRNSSEAITEVHPQLSRTRLSEALAVKPAHGLPVHVITLRVYACFENSLGKKVGYVLDALLKIYGANLCSPAEAP
jgi:hypothetical protein